MKLVAIAFLVAACGASNKPAPCPSCPTPPAVADCPTPTAPPTTPSPEPEPPTAEAELGVEYSVSAEQNFKKATEALANKNQLAARLYFKFIVDRFPNSRFAHDSELGIADITADREGPLEELCLFIEHHPFHPKVMSGEAACLTHKYKKQPCVAKEVYPPVCGKPTYCKDAKGDIAKRPECKLPDRS